MIDKERLLRTFLEYVQIDSESCHEGKAAERIIADAKEMGLEVYMDASGEKTGSEAGNIYLRLAGNTEGEAIIFSAHMDTVVPGNGIEPEVCDGVIRSKGGTVLGADDKSGIVPVLEAMRTVIEKKLPHPTIEAVFTTAEEIGLKGSKNLDYGRILGKKAVVLDGGGDAGNITTAAPGQYRMEAKITGRKSHAGVEPEKGISAIQAAAKAVASMRLLRIDEETTANIGTFTADYPTNIVPDQVTLIGEARSIDGAKLEAQKEHMLACLKDACEETGAKLEVSMEKLYGAYRWDENDEFVREVAAACEACGLPVHLGASGGGSDANNMNVNGIKALVLGTGMAKAHTVDEFITVKNLEDTAKLVLALMTR